LQITGTNDPGAIEAIGDKIIFNGSPSGNKGYTNQII
jgi:hypothetical protein